MFMTNTDILKSRVRPHANGKSKYCRVFHPRLDRSSLNKIGHVTGYKLTRLAGYLSHAQFTLYSISTTKSHVRNERTGDFWGLILTVFFRPRGWITFHICMTVNCRPQSIAYRPLVRKVSDSPSQSKKNQYMSCLVTKPTKWLCAQRRLRSALASAQSDQTSLTAWRNIGSSATHWAHREDFDQTGRMPRVIWVFAGHTCHFVGFVMRRLKSSYTDLSWTIKCWFSLIASATQRILYNKAMRDMMKGHGMSFNQRYAGSLLVTTPLIVTYQEVTGPLAQERRQSE